MAEFVEERPSATTSEPPAAPLFWSTKAGVAAVAAEGIAIVPVPVTSPPPPPPSTWSMPRDAVPDPVEQSPFETAAAILEALHGIAPILTGALVTVLGSCDKRALMTLFGMSPNEVADDRDPEPPPVEPDPEPLPHMCGQQQPDRGQSSWQWNDRGERISPRLPSSFPRHIPQPRGSHWSR
jgi:hypothetical protein